MNFDLGTFYFYLTILFDNFIWQLRHLTISAAPSSSLHLLTNFQTLSATLFLPFYMWCDVGGSRIGGQFRLHFFWRSLRSDHREIQLKHSIAFELAYYLQFSLELSGKCIYAQSLCSKLYTYIECIESFPENFYHFKTMKIFSKRQVASEWIALALLKLPKCTKIIFALTDPTVMLKVKRCYLHMTPKRITDF